MGGSNYKNGRTTTTKKKIKVLALLIQPNPKQDKIKKAQYLY